MTLIWTPARREGLLAFVELGRARESNRTGEDEWGPCVYWQTMRFLRDAGLVTRSAGSQTIYVLTQRGVDQLAAFGEQLSFGELS